MPNRILRDWTDSDRVNLLTADAERFFVRLIMKADDFGRYFAEPKRLKAFLFPLKDSLRDTDISRWLAECEKAGLLRCYEVTCKRYLELLNFRQRLRQMREIHPRPPWHDSNPPADGSQVAVECPLEVESESETEEKQNPKGVSVGNSTSEPELQPDQSPDTPLQWLKASVGTAYGRLAGFVWSYAEECALAEVARRPDATNEFLELMRYRRSLPGPDRRFFPNKVGTLLADWTGTLDRARGAKPVQIKSTPPPKLKGPQLTDAQRLEMGRQIAAVGQALK